MEKMDLEQYQKEVAVLRTQLEAANRKVLQIEADAKVDQEMTHEQVQMLETRAATIQNKLRKEVSKREDIEAERDCLKGQIAGLKDAKSKDSSEIKILKKRNSLLEKESEENRVKLRQLDTACRRLCNDFREESAVLKTLVQELSEAPAELLGNTFVAQIQAKVEEIFSVRMTAFRQENERLTEESQAQLRKSMEDVMSQRASTYESELEKSELEIEQLNERIESKEEEVKNLILQLSEYQRNVTGLQAEIAQRKSSSDELAKSNEERVQLIQENLEAQRLEIEKLEKDREDIIMGKMRDISVLEDQIEQLHIQYDSERKRASSLMDELSKIKKVEEDKTFTVLDPELAMAGMTSIQSFPESVALERVSAPAEDTDRIPKMQEANPPSANDVNGDSSLFPNLKLPSSVRLDRRDSLSETIQLTPIRLGGLSSSTNGEANDRHTTDLESEGTRTSLLDESETDEPNSEQEREESSRLEFVPKLDSSGVKEEIDDKSDSDHLSITARLPISVVKVSDLSEVIERDMEMVAETKSGKCTDENTPDEAVATAEIEAVVMGDIETVVEQASQMLLALDSIQKRLENLQNFEEFSEDLFSVTSEQGAEWKRGTGEAEFESNEELEREARQIIEELERDSKDTPLDAQLQLLKAKYDEGKISSQEFKRARVLLMYSQSMIDTEKAEQELKKAHKILVELREKRCEIVRSEAQPVLDITFEAWERISQQNEDLSQRLDELQSVFSQLVPSHVKATQLLNSMSVFVDEIEDQAESAQGEIQQAVKAEGDAEKLWYQQLRTYDRSLRNCHIMERFCKDTSQAGLPGSNQNALSNYVSWFYNVK